MFVHSAAMQERRQIVLFRALFFFLQAPIGILLPFFILHLKDELHFSDRAISYVTGMSGISILLFQQVWGYLGDCLFSKRMLIAVNSVAAGALFLALGSIRSLSFLLPVAFCFYVMFTPVNQLLNGFLFARQGGVVRFGNFRAYASLGYVAVIVVLGFVADRFFGGSLGVIFPAFFGICVICAVLVLMIPDAEPLGRERSHTFVDVQKHFLRRREVRWFLLVVFLHQAAHSLSYSLQAPLLSQMGADRQVVGLCYSVAAILELPVFFGSVQLRKRFGDVPLLGFAATVQAVRWMLVWNAQEPWEILLIQMSHCITFGVFYAAGVGYINEHAGERLKASGQTLFALVAQGFSSAFSNYVGGTITEGGSLEPAMRWFVVHVLHLPDKGALRNLYVACSIVAALGVAAAIKLYAMERRSVVTVTQTES